MAKIPTGKKINIPIRRQCGAMSVHFRLLEQDTAFRARQFDLERRTALQRAAPTFKKKVITIPVVVHVVYNKKSENISATQVRSQITVLNKDFQAKNTDKKKNT